MFLAAALSGTTAPGFLTSLILLCVRRTRYLPELQVVVFDQITEINLFACHGFNVCVTVSEPARAFLWKIAFQCS